MTGTNAGADRRGQAAIVGLVLLVGLVAVGSVGILLLGANANEKSQAEAQDERVKQGFLELDGDIDAVARSENGSRAVNLELPSESDVAVREDATGRIWVNKTNFTTLNEQVIVNRSIGVVRYSRDDGTTYAFQGGGVFKEQGNNTRLLSPPAFAYELNRSGDSPTLTLPIVVTTGDEQLTSGDVGIRQNKTIAPTNDVSLVENELVTVKVRSRWYVGWAQYFRQIAAPGGVSVDHSNDTATLKLVVPVTRGRVVAGVIAGAQGQDVEFNQKMGMDSYNSSAGDYSSTKKSDTNVVVAGDVVINQNVDIGGDVTAGEDIKFNNNGKIQGNASYGDELLDCTSGPSCSSISPTDSTSLVDGWHDNNASVLDYQPVDDVIDSRSLVTKNNNNNSAASAISGNSLTGCSSTCHLWSGQYFLDNLDFSGTDKLVIHANGPVNIVVNGTLQLENTNGGGPGIEVKGNGRVNVYINSETGSGTDDLLVKQADVTVPDERSPQLWFYMDKNADVLIRNGDTKFVGVVFGPGIGDTEPKDGVDIETEQKAQIYGALVGDINANGNNVDIHFDKALRNTRTITTSAKVPRLTFLHASVYEVCLQDSDQNSDDCTAP